MTKYIGMASQGAWQIAPIKFEVLECSYCGRVSVVKSDSCPNCGASVVESRQREIERIPIIIK